MTRYLALVSALCVALINAISTANAANIANVLVDPNATGETRTLYINLKNLSTTRSSVWPNKRILFGHQNTTVEGLGFHDPNGGNDQSDVVTSVGAFPAVYGYDFNRGSGPTAGVASYSMYQQHLNNAYSRDGIVVFSWHAKNPVTGGNVYDLSGNPVSQILSGGPARAVYLGWLDDIATFAGQIGRPIIFRPLMEENGHWFWWGTSNASATQFVSLWRLTVEYLRDTKGVHNILYAFTPDAGAPNFYGATYPGDDYVDILGGDIYGVGNFSSTILSTAKTIVNLAAAKGKVAAITEVGPRDSFGGPNATNDFYTNVLLNTINGDATARKIAFFHVWRNNYFDNTKFWVPMPGHSAHAEFVSFFNHPATVFANRQFDMYRPMATAIQGFPYCVSPNTVDPDGDGWGWENQKYSCIMSGGLADLSFGAANSNYDYCLPDQPILDPEGDGWGWQNQATCIIPGSPPDPAANW